MRLTVKQLDPKKPLVWCRSGSYLDPDSIGSVDPDSESRPDPGGQI
jgi:hypothetical protein